jgi:nitrilase
MGPTDTAKLAHAETFGHGIMQETLAAMARRFGLWIVAGTLPLRGQGNRVRASSLVFDDRGQCAARYDKIHLFDVQVSDTEAHEESRTIEPGEQLVVVDTPAGRLGLSVCYDVRFPELYRALALKGAELFTVVSAFTRVTGAAHWSVLLRARAIENQCVVLAPNQCGTHASKRETYGHSMVIDAWGDVIAQLDDKEGVVSAEIDLQALHALRRTFPVTTHRVLQTDLPIVEHTRL